MNTWIVKARIKRGRDVDWAPHIQARQQDYGGETIEVLVAVAAPTAGDAKVMVETAGAWAEAHVENIFVAYKCSGCNGSGRHNHWPGCGCGHCRDGRCISCGGHGWHVDDLR